jgi:hypothetical protein
MKCRACHSTNTRVTVTEHHGEVTWRYSRCLDCGERFKTIETYARALNSGRKGPESPSAIFTREEILFIRKLHECGLSNQQIAVRYHCDRSVISKIITRKTYTNVA